MLKNNIKIALTSLMLIGLAMAFSGNAEAQKFNATEWKTLSGYPGMIYDVEFSPKGNYFALYAEDPIELYDLNWNKIWSYQGYKTNKIGSTLAFSPDEKYLVFARCNSDRDIAILRLSDLQIVQNVTGNSGQVNSIAFSPDGNFFASAGGAEIKIWRFFNDQLSEVQTLTGHSADIEKIDFSPNGKYLASGADDNTIKIWKHNILFFSEMQTLTKHSDWVRCVAFSPDGMHLASGSDDKTVKIWEINDDKFSEKQTLTGHTHFVMDLSFSPDGLYLASASEDTTIKIWHLRVGYFLEGKPLTGHSGHVYSIDFIQNGKYLASGSADYTAKIWEIQGIWSLASLLGQTYELTDQSSSIQQTEITPPQTDITPPQIAIIEPILTRGMRAKKSTKNVVVKGKATDPSGIYEVTVNGKGASVTADGDFQSEVRLAYGENTITVTATDMKNNLAIKTFTIDRESISPPQPQRVQLTLSGKYYGLFIAVQDYTDRNVNDLDFPIQDAEKLIDVLKTYYIFDQANIHVLKNPDRKTIIKKLSALRKELTEEDNLLIFYSGHGYWDEEIRQGYWLPCNASLDDTSEWLSNSTIRDYIRGIKTRHTLVVSDACFSGGLFKVRAVFTDEPDASIKKIYEMPSRKAITSGAMKTVPDRSVFLEYLVKNLKRNKAKYLYSEKLYIDMKPAVINNSLVNQTPLYGTIQQAGDEGGDFIFIRR